MVDHKFLGGIPLKRIKPVDGLAVTSDVWEEAHEYHRLHQITHNLLWHGYGIVSGLEVIASDPADSSVYIRPGIAVDPSGQLIVLPEPVAFDLGASQGMLYIQMLYDESNPRQDRDGGPLYIHAQFTVEASLKAPRGQAIELARLHRLIGQPVVNAPAGSQPDVNAIDLRYRTLSSGKASGPLPVASIAICHMGGGPQGDLTHGAGNLAKYLRQHEKPTWVDERVSIGSGLEAYTLVYMVGWGAFSLNREELNGLYAYVRGGGTLLMESCRSDHSEGPTPADAIFSDLVNSFGIPVEEVKPGSALLAEPSLFGCVPDGFETNYQPTVMAGEGLVISTADYGCLWQGRRRGRPATRAEISAGLEWGENLVAFAQNRKQETSR